MRNILRPFRLSISLLAVAVAGSIALPLPGCLGILGDYEIDPTFNANGDKVEAGRTLCTTETQTTDCKSNEECYTSFCVRRCVDVSYCGDGTDTAYYECSSTCSIKLGDPCNVSESCGTGYCLDVDAKLNTVEKYCSIFCTDDAEHPLPQGSCPSGFSCVQNNCHTGYSAF